jgi:hypothetical protein
MLKALIAGTGTPEELADLAQRRMRRKRAALGEAITGRVIGHHRFMLELSPPLVISSPVETSPIDQLARSPQLRGPAYFQVGGAYYRPFYSEQRDLRSVARPS